MGAGWMTTARRSALGEARAGRGTPYWVEAPDGSAAYLMIADKALGVRRVDRVDYGSLTTQSLTFDGVPEAIGLMEETGQLYVSQTGAGGRITFVDLATGERHEISAYELNAYIE